MFINRFRSLYSLTYIKPASLVPPCNTRLTMYFCTQNKQELKPEDTFGNYVADRASRYPSENCEDEPKGTDLSVLEALEEIKKLINAHEFDKANELFIQFKKTKRPPPHMYKLLFASAARLGKVEEAYKIYNDLKKRGLYADGAMFTSLFYACAKCPRSDIALPIANKLVEHLFRSKKFEPNKSNFNAVMMAYGRHGDISTVMLLVDKMEDQGIRLSCRNYNFALESCISQKNAGLRFAILIWHHMLRKKIVPDSYTFSILGRCVRDCSLGDSELQDQFIKSIFTNCSGKKIIQSRKMKLNSGELVINLKEEPQQFCGSDEKGGDAERTNSSGDDNGSKFSDAVSNVENSREEHAKLTDCANLDAESVEKIQQCSHSVAVESSNDCSLTTETKEESQCGTHSDVDSEKDVGEVMGMSETADRGQTAELQSAVDSEKDVRELMGMSETADRGQTAELQSTVDSEKDVGELMGMSETADRGQTAELQSTVDSEKDVGELMGMSETADRGQTAELQSTVDSEKDVGELMGMSETADRGQTAELQSTVDSEKDVGELMGMSETADRGQTAELQSAVECSSQVERHRFDDSDLPNVLTLKPPGKSILNFGDLSTAQNRLMLFGGLNGFLKTMDDYKAKPDIVLFSILLSCIPSTEEDEEALMNEMLARKVRVDTTFLNILIQRRVLRKEDSTIEDFLDLFKKYKRRPDAVTIGTIARSCVTHESGMKCIQLARSHNIRLNKAILGCLLENARKTGDIDYVSDILKAGKEDDTELDMRFTSTLKSIVENEKMKRRKSIS